MCGINGIIFKTSKTDVSKILKMNALLDHRGPDDSGFINYKNLLLVYLIVDLNGNTIRFVHKQYQQCLAHLC